MLSIEGQAMGSDEMKLRFKTIGRRSFVIVPKIMGNQCILKNRQ